MNNKQNIAKPFLKWAGGKSQLISEIKKGIPYNENDSFTYIEPFVGSGAVLFWILTNYPNIESAIINDVNTDLTDCYKTIKTNVEDLISILFEFENEYNSLENGSEKRKLAYYEKRELFNKRTLSKIEQSALFIFLNRTCFNGLYRVNRKNGFNVPQGNYKKPQICNADNLLAVSKVLQKVEIINGDFAETIEFTNDNSFFYFDPPYKPLSETSSFNSYSKDSFDDNEQIRLKEFCDKLNSLGYSWVLSNSDVKGTNSQDDFFDDLFEQYEIKRVLASRRINANAKKRGELTELLITNKKELVYAV